MQSLAFLVDIAFIHKTFTFKIGEVLTVIQCLLKVAKQSQAPKFAFHRILLAITDFLFSSDAPNADHRSIFKAALNMMCSVQVQTMHSKMNSIKRITHVLYGHPKQLEQHVCQCKFNKMSVKNATVLFDIYENNLSW